MSADAVKVGDTVVAVPVGQKRRQTILVTQILGEFAIGRLVSKKWPGDFRGTAVAYLGDCELVEG